jgi:hypothetical protein
MLNKVVMKFTRSRAVSRVIVILIYCGRRQKISNMPLRSSTIAMLTAVRR